MKTLDQLSLAELVALHNRIAARTGAKEAGPKTFSTRAKALARVKTMATEQELDYYLKDSEKGETEDMARDHKTVVRALLGKTVESGATEGEEAAALEKARELIAKHKLDPKEFLIPQAVLAREGKRIAAEAKAKKATEEPRAKPAEKPEPKKAAPPKAKPAEKPKPAASGRIIRVAAEELLLRVDHWRDKDGNVVPEGTRGAVSMGLSYDDILQRIKREFPDGSTSIACLRWYATHMKERGERMPQGRPRPAKGKKAA